MLISVSHIFITPSFMYIQMNCCCVCVCRIKQIASILLETQIFRQLISRCQLASLYVCVWGSTSRQRSACIATSLSFDLFEAASSDCINFSQTINHTVQLVEEAFRQQFIFTPDSGSGYSFFIIDLYISECIVEFEYFFRTIFNIIFCIRNLNYTKQWNRMT